MILTAARACPAKAPPLGTLSESWFRTTVSTGTIPREGNGNGSQVFQGFNNRLRFRFVDTNRVLLKKWGQTVQLTGTIRRPGPLLDYCFVVSFLLLSRGIFPSNTGEPAGRCRATASCGVSLLPVQLTSQTLMDPPLINAT